MNVIYVQFCPYCRMQRYVYYILVDEELQIGSARSNVQRPKRQQNNSSSEGLAPYDSQSWMIEA